MHYGVTLAGTQEVTWSLAGGSDVQGSEPACQGPIEASGHLTQTLSAPKAASLTVASSGATPASATLSVAVAADRTGVDVVHWATANPTGACSRAPRVDDIASPARCGAFTYHLPVQLTAKPDTLALDNGHDFADSSAGHFQGSAGSNDCPWVEAAQNIVLSEFGTEGGPPVLSGGLLAASGAVAPPDEARDRADRGAAGCDRDLHRHRRRHAVGRNDDRAGDAAPDAHVDAARRRGQLDRARPRHRRRAPRGHARQRARALPAPRGRAAARRRQGARALAHRGTGRLAHRAAGDRGQARSRRLQATRLGNGARGRDDVRDAVPRHVPDVLRDRPELDVLGDPARAAARQGASSGSARSTGGCGARGTSRAPGAS